MSEDPSNALEMALIKAADDPAQRPEFYRLLLESEVFVLGETQSKQDGRRIVTEGEKLLLMNWQKEDGTPVIPFFSSIDALRRAITEVQSYLGLPARTLFEMTKGASLVLNPRSDYGKEFFPKEIEDLLRSGVNRTEQSRVVQEPTEVLLGEPEHYPTEMVSALKSLLAKHPAVKAAYLCLMQERSSQDGPNLVVGVEGDGDLDRIVRQAGAVAADTAPKGEPVDFVRVTKGEKGLSEYFLSSVPPFYTRSWIKSLFQ